jgi:hypothetical protein
MFRLPLTLALALLLSTQTGCWFILPPGPQEHGAVRNVTADADPNRVQVPEESARTADPNTPPARDEDDVCCDFPEPEGWWLDPYWYGGAYHIHEYYYRNANGGHRNPPPRQGGDGKGGTD